MKNKMKTSVAVFLLLTTGCTKHVELPSVALDNAQSIDGVVSITARVIDDGGDLTDAGVFYKKGVSNTPYNDGLQKSVGANKEIKLNLYGLDEGPYSICAYATNQVGIVYSDAVTVGDYAVTGRYVVSSDKKSVTLYGEAYAPLGTSFSRVGFVWAKNPGDGWLKEVSGFYGKTEASFQTSLSVSSGETLYYYAMFQTNKGDTFYGKRRSFNVGN